MNAIRRGGWAAALAIVMTPAQADVTVRESIAVNGGGLMSFANLQGTSTTQISGSKARMESDVQMQSRLARLFAGGPTAEITRLDDDQVFELDLKKKRYTQTSLSARRAEMEKALAQRAEAGKSQNAGTLDPEECEWSAPKAEVKKSGEKATIAGFASAQSTITVTQSCKHKQTGEVCDVGLALEQWLAPKFDGSAERQAFYTRYARQMGLDGVGSRDFAQNAQAMFAGYKELWAEVAKKAATLDGYPVRASFALAIGGAQCGSQQQAAAAGNPAAGAMAAAGELGTALGGLFGKKKDAAPPPPPAPVLLVNGMTPLVTVSTELLSIGYEPVAAATFEPPADFKKSEE